MLQSRHSLYKSFVFAFDGLTEAIKNGRNFKIQIVIGIIAIFLGLILKLSSFEWLSLIIIATFILILELINTSLEALVDMVSPGISAKAKIAKDVAAASVLVASVSAVIVGLILFLPKILTLL